MRPLHSRPETLLVVSSLALALPASARADDPRCEGLGAARSDTVIALSAAGDFTICRRGAVQDDVVAGRPVWLELRRQAGPSLYEFRLAERESEPAASGLATWQEQATGLAWALRGLGESAQTIEELPPRAPVDPRLRALETARALYLGVTTTRFHESLRDVAADGDELPAIAASVRRWCDGLVGERDLPEGLAARLRSACAGAPSDEGAVRREVDLLQNAIRAFHDRRSVAREAVVAAESMPDDAGRQQEAVRALDTARAAVLEVLAAAERLRPIARGLADATRLLREAVHSRGLLRPGVPVFLARYGHSGNGVLRVEARPAGIIVAGVAAANADTRTLTYRFAIVATHYVDLEVGLGIAGGLPDVPSLGTTNGMAAVQGKSVDQFVALALVELEPLRFPWPDKPLAGLLRLPVVGIPMSENPADNFFIGAGLGWTGVGSVTVGPYIARELSLRPGYTIGQTLPAGASFAAITQPAIQVGYYVSVSVDLVGLFHLFVPVHVKSIDASTGKEL